MASIALVDASTWVSGFDFTTRLNELSVEPSIEALDDTRFGTPDAPRVGRSRIGGLEDVETELNGYWESLDPGSADAAAFAGLGSSLEVVTHSVDGAEESVSYMYQARKFTYQLGGEVGAILPFTLNIMGAGGNNNPGVVRGQVAAANQDVSATGALGSAVNLGAVGSGEFLYATLHVFTAGTSITVELQSDADNTFGTPTTQATFNGGPITAAGGFWAPRAAGPISDTWYRLAVTAITGTFTVAGAIGID